VVSCVVVSDPDPTIPGEGTRTPEDITQTTRIGPAGLVRRRLIGGAVAAGTIVALCALMVPFRSHLSLATPALVLVVPVVLGVAIGGLSVGVLAVVAGFLAYDWLFIPPYSSLTVGAADNWVPLGVYAVVMLVVARVFAFLQSARAEASRHEADTQRMFALTDRLIGERPLSELLDLVVTTIQRSFSARWVALLLPEDPDGGNVTISATAGAPIPEEVRAALVPTGGQLQSLGTGSRSGLTRLVLTAATRPVGLLVLADAVLTEHDWALLRTYANQAALAVDHARLREQARRTALLEAVDQLRGALMSAVSHDLRTPLASIKTAVSTLRRPDLDLAPDDRAGLLELIEQQSDALARLVTNLLDMTRIESGALRPDVQVCAVSDVVEDAITALGTVAGGDRVEVNLSPHLPLIAVDQTLMTHVVANLVDNGIRHSPPSATVEIAARVVERPDAADQSNGAADGTHGDCGVELLVTDRGPGVPRADRDRIFEMFNRSSGGERAGLGLAIARSFVEAHGERIWVEDGPEGGARFVLTMPAAWVPSEIA
jgi:two-component system sensor histidine kinase KdpD